jgi:hypothetical protein
VTRLLLLSSFMLLAFGAQAHADGVCQESRAKYPKQLTCTETIDGVTQTVTFTVARELLPNEQGICIPPSGLWIPICAPGIPGWHGSLTAAPRRKS